MASDSFQGTNKCLDSEKIYPTLEIEEVTTSSKKDKVQSYSVAFKT